LAAFGEFIDMNDAIDMSDMGRGGGVAFDLPPELDLAVYREHNVDLQKCDDQQLLKHYELQGRYEGRAANIAATRDGFLKLTAGAESALELGPFCNPLLTGDKVMYFDVLDREQLRSRARSLGLSDSQCPHIDFVSAVGDLSIINRKFDIVFSSHAVEHQPNLIKHFRDVASLLDPGGRYFLIVPDKRYSFDHFIAESTIADVLGAHLEGRVIHTASNVLEHRLLLTHNDPGRHWRGDHSDASCGQIVQNAHNAIREWETCFGQYIDVHAWKFTPESFRCIVSLLRQIGVTTFSVERIYSTTYGSIEFRAVLKKDL
jgi:hypothetical protein